MKFSDYNFPSKYDKPFQHQVETVKFYLRNMRGYNLSTMGTGKTLSSLWAADFLMINKKISTVLIIAPLSTLEAVWRKEIFENLFHRRGVVLHGHKAKRIELLNKDYDFYIINHDGIKVIEDQLIAKKFDLIIIDELTGFKTATTDRAKCLIRIANGVKKRKIPKVRAVWGLTGSPAAQSPIDVFGQAKIVVPNNPHLPRYFGQFRDLVMIKDEYDEFNYLPRPGWESTVSKVLQPSIRYTLRECVDLPPTVYEEREVPMSKEQDKAYKDMVKHFVTEVNEGRITAANAGVKYIKLLQISAGVVYDEEKVPRRLNPTKKMSELVSIHRQAGNEPVIVLVAFKEAIKMVADHLKAFNVVTMSGDTPSKQRGDIVNKFQNGEIDFLIAQPKVASHGLTLTRSNVLVWYGPYPSNEVTQQANARIVRPGQRRAQLIIRLYSSPSEKRLFEGLDNKERMSTLLLELLK